MGRNGVSRLPNTGPENGMMFEVLFWEGLRADETMPTQRDPHLQCIADHGCMGWQKASGYTNMPVSRGRSLYASYVSLTGPSIVASRPSSARTWANFCGSM